jgi:hypothetical protein
MSRKEDGGWKRDERRQEEGKGNVNSFVPSRFGISPGNCLIKAETWTLTVGH